MKGDLDVIRYMGKTAAASPPNRAGPLSPSSARTLVT